MSDTPKTPPKTPPSGDSTSGDAHRKPAARTPSAADTSGSREDRLASALRANLRRRKGAPKPGAGARRSLLDEE